MDNFLDTGSILPHGLLADNNRADLAGFNKTYKNSGLRIGVIVKRYDVSDKANRSKLTVEYDVVTTEQDEMAGITTTLYRNCPATDGFGSVGDFFERTFRPQKKKMTKGQTQQMKNQDGAIVLLLCLDSASDRGVIVGGFNHPNRKSKLKADQHRLEGEFNGVNIQVNDDGSTSLAFKGKTDNSGTPTDPKQGVTTLSIEADGSFQFQHDSITNRLDRNGKAMLTTSDEITNNTKTNFNVAAEKDLNLTAKGNANVSVAKLIAQASGDATFASQNFAISAQSAFTVKASTMKVTAESMASIKASQITLDGMCALGGPGGQPLLTLSSQFLAVGNLGIPIIGTAISGFTTKVTAT